MQLYEELFETPDDTTLGVTNLIISAINKKWENITDFNGIIATLREYQYEDMIPVLEEIIVDENNNIGKLQQLVELISPTAKENIEVGKEEAIETLDDVEPVIESLNESFDKDIYDWLHDHYGTTNWKTKFKNYIDKLESSGYNTTTLKRDTSIAIKKFSKEAKVKPQVFMSALQESLRNPINIERNTKLAKSEDVVESLQEDVDSNSNIYYVSYYEETPVYRPEEGGYYEANCELISSEEFDNLEDAKERIKELAEDDIMEKISDEFYLDRSRYIGQDRFYIIETEQGSESNIVGEYE